MRIYKDTKTVDDILKIIKNECILNNEYKANYYYEISTIEEGVKSIIELDKDNNKRKRIIKYAKEVDQIFNDELERTNISDKINCVLSASILLDRYNDIILNLNNKELAILSTNCCREELNEYYKKVILYDKEILELLASKYESIYVSIKALENVEYENVEKKDEILNYIKTSDENKIDEDNIQNIEKIGQYLGSKGVRL